MRIALISCMVFNRELNYEIAHSANLVHAYWLRQELHDIPDALRKKLQEQINLIEEEQQNSKFLKKYDVICIAYGLCSNCIAGIHSKSIPLIIPRCHDCISLFLGSHDKYMMEFRKNAETYWFNPGWIEHGYTPSEESYEERYQSYVVKKGEKKARRLREIDEKCMDGYKRIAYITSPVYHNESYRDYTKKSATYHNCDYEELEGSMSYLHEIINGPWLDARFLTVPPHHEVYLTYDDTLVESRPLCHCDDISPCARGD